MASVLAGIRVLELPSGVAGAMAGMLLADNGAEVIKIEPPDDAPALPPHCRTVWERGKRSVVADLREPAGQAVVRELMRHVDVLIEGHSPGELADLGLGYASVSSDNDQLIYCSITGYGRNTRYSQRPGYDALVAARLGLQWEQRSFNGGQPPYIAGIEPEPSDFEVPPRAEQTANSEGPVFLAPPWPSIGACLLATTGISAALRSRQLTGRGQWVETSLLQGGLLTTMPTWQRVPEPERPGFRLAYFDRRHPKGFFECSDGRWIHNWAPIDHGFARAAARGSSLELPAPDDIVKVPIPSGYHDQLAAEVAAHLETAEAYLKFPSDEWVKLFALAGKPAQPIRTPEEGLCDKISLQEGCVAEVVDPEEGTTRQVGLVYRMSKTPGAIRGGAPRKGEHTHDPLAGLADRANGAARPEQVCSLAAPLDGIRVLDLGLAQAGPYGAQVLADLGADVIKINRVDERGAAVSSPTLSCNRGKRSLAVDLKSAKGQAILHQLVATADVVHHNMRTGVAERLRADYETLRQIQPGLIYCHTRGFESSGPRAVLPGNDQMGQALAGTWYEMGASHLGGAPTWHTAALGDFGCGMMSAAAVIQALYHRDRSGEGQFVDTSILNVAYLFNSYTFVREDGTGPQRLRLDLGQNGLSALYRLYPTVDDWVCVVVATPAHWDALVGVLAGIGVTGIGSDSRFESPAARAEHDAELVAALEAAFASRPAADWLRLLDVAGVPCEISNPKFIREVFDDSELRARGVIVGYPHPRVGLVEQSGHLMEFSATPGRIRGPSPVVGEHSRELLAELKYDDREIDALVAGGIIAEMQ